MTQPRLAPLAAAPSYDRSVPDEPYAFDEAILATASPGPSPRRSGTEPRSPTVPAITITSWRGRWRTGTASRGP
jgi:hypothetical protein